MIGVLHICITFGFFYTLKEKKTEREACDLSSGFSRRKSNFLLQAICTVHPVNNFLFKITKSYFTGLTYMAQSLLYYVPPPEDSLRITN